MNKLKLTLEYFGIDQMISQLKAIQDLSGFTEDVKLRTIVKDAFGKTDYVIKMTRSGDKRPNTDLEEYERQFCKFEIEIEEKNVETKKNSV